MDKILITGSEGTVGRVIFKGLREKFELFTLDILGDQNNTHFICDISDYTSLSGVLESIGKIKCILHFAADHKVDASWKSVLKNNIVGTKNVYECAKQFSVDKVVFASSNQVMKGNVEDVKSGKTQEMVTTSEPVRPQSYYGVSKVFGEAIARMYFEVYQINSICLRLGTVTKDNRPFKNDLVMRRWLSYDDLIQLVEKSIKSDVDFGIYYGVSANDGGYLDISTAQDDLGYIPQDNSSNHV